MARNKGKRDIDPSVALRLKQYRREKGLSINGMARLSETSASYLSRVEKGERRAITTPILEAWCNVLGISMFKLMNVPTDVDQTKTLPELLVEYDYTVGHSVLANRQIKEAIIALLEAVIGSNLTGENQYRDALLIVEKAKRLKELIR